MLERLPDDAGWMRTESVWAGWRWFWRLSRGRSSRALGQWGEWIALTPAAAGMGRSGEELEGPDG